jgi:hypothetical protein
MRKKHLLLPLGLCLFVVGALILNAPPVSSCNGTDTAPDCSSLPLRIYSMLAFVLIPISGFVIAFGLAALFSRGPLR